MKNNTLTLSVKTVLSVMFLSLVGFSCAKKASGVRTVRQTQANVVNAAVSNPSNQAANAQNLLYQMTVVELPQDAQDGVFTVNSEIRTPSNKYVPITTTHSNGSEARGTITDPDNGVLLDIRSRCIGGACEQYVMLVTVIKNNAKWYQMAVISYSHQEYFNLETINAAVAPSQMYNNLDEVIQRAGDRYK